MRLGLLHLGAAHLAALTITSACAPEPYWKGPVGVSDKAEVASDRSIDMDGGGDNSACAHNPSLLEGKPCAPEGAICGNANPDPHQFSNVLVCREGEWDREEAPPAPSASAKPTSSSSAKP